MILLTVYIKKHNITRRLVNSGYERIKKEALTNGNPNRQATGLILGQYQLKDTCSK